MGEQHEHDDLEHDGVRLIDVRQLATENHEGTCLRPLGLCELSGACDVCWYRPDHPRFQRG